MIYANFKRFTEQGNRVAIFGISIANTNDMEITVIKCSKKDMFDKKLAWQIYASPNFNLNGIQYHPIKYTIKINTEEPRNSFQKHVQENFYSLKVNYIKVPALLQKVALDKRDKLDLSYNFNWIKTVYLSK